MVSFDREDCREEQDGTPAQERGVRRAPSGAAEADQQPDAEEEAVGRIEDRPTGQGIFQIAGTFDNEHPRGIDEIARHLW